MSSEDVAAVETRRLSGGEMIFKCTPGCGRLFL